MDQQTNIPSSDKTPSQKPGKPLWFRVFRVVLAMVLIAILTNQALFAIYFYPTTTQAITKNVYAVNDGFVDLFLITDGRTWIAVDSGQNPPVVTSALNKLHIQPEQVSAVLLTHSDYDHAGGLNALPNAKIYISDKEEPLVTHKVHRQPFAFNSPLPRPYTLLHDGETLNFGSIKVRAIATPGHTLGSTAYVVNGDMLFTGDTLVLTRGGKVRLSYWIYNMDGKTEAASIHMLAHLKGVRWVFSAHTGYSDDSAGAFKGW